MSNKLLQSHIESSNFSLCNYFAIRGQEIQVYDFIPKMFIDLSVIIACGFMCFVLKSCAVSNFLVGVKLLILYIQLSLFTDGHVV